MIGGEHLLKNSDICVGTEDYPVKGWCWRRVSLTIDSPYRKLVLRLASRKGLPLLPRRRPKVAVSTRALVDERLDSRVVYGMVL